MEWLDNVLRSFEKGVRRRNHQGARAKVEAKEEAKAEAKAGRPPAKPDARPTVSRGPTGAHEAAPRSPREEVGIGLGRIFALYYRSSTSYQIRQHIRYLSL